MLKLEAPSTVSGGWGPPLRLSDDAPLFPVSVIDRMPPTRVGKACDFTQATQERLRQMTAKQVAEGVDLSQHKRRNYLQQHAPAVVEDGFAMVDTKVKKKQTNFRPRVNFQQMQQQKAIKSGGYQQGILGTQKKHVKTEHGKGKDQKGKGKGKGKGWFNRQPQNIYREWSISVQPDWEMKHELMLLQLAKIGIDMKGVVVTDLLEMGRQFAYDKSYDRLQAKQGKHLANTRAEFYNPTASDDDVLRTAMQDDESVDVIATDHALGCIMAAGRSVYSWDLVFTKIGGKVIIDKRDGSAVDLISVNETAPEPPVYLPENKGDPDGPVCLAREAMRVNQDFTEMVLDREEEPKENEPHPFAEDEDAVSGTSYRYRKIVLPGDKKSASSLKSSDLTLVVRAETHAVNGSSRIVARCLNEFVVKKPELDKKKPESWKSQLDSQPGAVLAQATRLNGFKMGRWISQALLAGADSFKLGFVTRAMGGSPDHHTLLSVQTNPVKQLAQQINLVESNAYGILRYMIDLVRVQKEDGKYVLLKDPLKPLLRLYAVPWDANLEEEEEEEEDESDEEEHPVY